jgi:hypothetical protein
MLEKDIERALCKRVMALGGLCEKFVSPGRRSVPDRIITLPGGIIVFAEVKTPNKKPTPLQERDHTVRRSLGCRVLVIDSMDSANAFAG